MYKLTPDQIDIIEETIQAIDYALTHEWYNTDTMKSEEEFRKGKWLQTQLEALQTIVNQA